MIEIMPWVVPPAGIGSWLQSAPDDVGVHDQPGWSPNWSSPPPSSPCHPVSRELPAGSVTETVSAPVPAEPVSLTWKKTLVWWCPPWTSTDAVSRTAEDGLGLGDGGGELPGGRAGLVDAGGLADGATGALRLADAGTTAGAVVDRAGVEEGRAGVEEGCEVVATATGDAGTCACSVLPGFSGVPWPANETPKAMAPSAMTAAPPAASQRSGRAVSRTGAAGRSHPAIPAAACAPATGAASVRVAAVPAR